jgi:molybdate/tungstate transport system substrate-binding protein
MSDAAVSVFDVHTTGSYLEEHGFLQREQFPAYSGDVPQRVKQIGEASNEPQSRLDTPNTTLSTVSDITVLI